MNKLIFILISFTLLLMGCLKLDDLPFLGEKIERYSFDNYGKWDGFILDNSYKIADSNIHLFTLNSQLPSENSPTTIYATYIGNMNTITQDTIIVYLHGQSKHMDYYWQRTKLLANVGSKNRFGILTMDYRGYGLSEGKSTEASLYQDVATCLDWLKNKGVSNQKVIIFGYSLGTIPAIDRSVFNTAFLPSKLIIESPLASVQNLTEESFILNVEKDFVSSLEFDNAEKIKSVSQPLMWMHGTDDDYLAISNGELIYDNYQGPYKEAHIARGANHGNVPETFGLTNYSNRVLNFILK